MRIACVLPMSRSIFRHRGVKDHIQTSGLLGVARYLELRKHEVRVFNYLAEENAERVVLNRQLVEYRPNLIIICAMFRIEDVTEFLSLMPPVEPKPHIACFGTGAIDFRLCLQRAPLLDFAIPVDPEAVAADCADALLAGTPVEAVHGLAYRSNGDIHFTMRTATPLDEVFDGMEMDMFVSSDVPATAYIWGSRGCWYRQCTFCTVGAASRLCRGEAWMPRDMDSIVNDIVTLHGKGIKHFHFLDAEFIGPGDRGQLRAQSFGKELIRNKMDIRFYVDARVDCIHDDTIRLLREAGLSSVFVGVESGCQSILDRMRKGYGLADVERSVRVLRRWKVPFRIGWALADPESSLEEVKESVDTIWRLQLFDGLLGGGACEGSVFHELHLHAGTPMYRRVMDNRGDGDLVESEIPCEYFDDGVSELVRRARHFRLEIERRYRWARESPPTEPGNAHPGSRNNEKWQRQYDYALRVLAINGIKNLIEKLFEERKSCGTRKTEPKSLERILRAYDEYWLGKEFDDMSSSSGPNSMCYEDE